MRKERCPRKQLQKGQLIIWTEKYPILHKVKASKRYKNEERKKKMSKNTTSKVPTWYYAPNVSTPKSLVILFLPNAPHHALQIIALPPYLARHQLHYSMTNYPRSNASAGKKNPGLLSSLDQISLDCLNNWSHN